MTQEEYREFMLDRPRTAVLATVRADGRPHAAPIWFDLDGDELVFTTGESTIKGRNMLRDPRVSLCIDEEEPPFHFVLIEGTSELTADDPDLLYWTTRLGGATWAQTEPTSTAQCGGGRVTGTGNTTEDRRPQEHLRLIAGLLTLAQKRLELFIWQDQLPTAHQRPVLESAEVLHPHQPGMAGDRFGFHDDAFGEAGVSGDVLCERIFIAPVLDILHAGGMRFCRFAYTSVRHPTFPASARPKLTS